MFANLIFFSKKRKLFHTLTTFYMNKNMNLKIYSEKDRLIKKPLNEFSGLLTDLRSKSNYLSRLRLRSFSVK